MVKQSDLERYFDNQTRHEPDMGLYENEPGMSSAEFKCMREYMGFTTRWLSMKWGVSEFSIQRWERNRTPPPDLVHWLRAMLDQFDRWILDSLEWGEDPIEIPRTDDDISGAMPAAVYRHMAMVASSMSGARIVYMDEDGAAHSKTPTPTPAQEPEPRDRPASERPYYRPGLFRPVMRTSANDTRRTYGSILEAAEDLIRNGEGNRNGRIATTQANIGHALHGRAHTAYGYHWQYIDDAEDNSSITQEKPRPRRDAGSGA